MLVLFVACKFSSAVAEIPLSDFCKALIYVEILMANTFMTAHP